MRVTERKCKCISMDIFVTFWWDFFVFYLLLCHCVLLYIMSTEIVSDKLLIT